MAQEVRHARTLPKKVVGLFSCLWGAAEEGATPEGEQHRRHGRRMRAARLHAVDLISTSSGCKSSRCSGSSETASSAGSCSHGSCHKKPHAGGASTATESQLCNDGWNPLAKECPTPAADLVPAGWCRKDAVASACTVPGAAPDMLTQMLSPAMLLSLRKLHMALAPMDFSQQASPLMTDSPCADTRPASSVDFIGLGCGDWTTSDSSDPISMSGVHPQLRFVNASKLGEEVQDLQLLGRGGYGMVMTGNWRQEGRVAVKVLLSDEDKWMESCYKEAVLSKMLAHPNILQTYDFQVAVLAPSDVARAKASWDDLQQRIHQQHLQQAARAACDPLGLAAAGGAVGTPGQSVCCHSSGVPLMPEPRADSFELLPAICASSLDAAGAARPGAMPAATDLWQVLFMLGARPGQFVTLIIMEYAEVGTLQRAIAAGSFRESPRLSKWAALRSLLVTAKEIAGGMCLLHSYKIIHGDLSATNVMLRCSRIDKRGFVAKVADFGLSKVTLSGVARTDDWAGQAQYIAPECLDYEARLASDVFAFGVMLYEMASGRKAFADYQPAQILAGRLAGDLELEWPADAPPALRALAERCMLQDPEARPSFREVVEDLRRQDNEAKAQHRQCTMRRRYTGDGMSAAAALAAAASAGALYGGSTAVSPAFAASAATASSGRASAVPSFNIALGRTPSPLGPYRSPVFVAPSSAAAAAAAVTAATAAAAAAGAMGAADPSCQPPPFSAQPSRYMPEPSPVSPRWGSSGALSPTPPLRHSHTAGTAWPGAAVPHATAPAAVGIGEVSAAAETGAAAAAWPEFHGFPVTDGSAAVTTGLYYTCTPPCGVASASVCPAVAYVAVPYSPPTVAAVQAPSAVSGYPPMSASASACASASATATASDLTDFTAALASMSSRVFTCQNSSLCCDTAPSRLSSGRPPPPLPTPSQQLQQPQQPGCPTSQPPAPPLIPYAPTAVLAAGAVSTWNMLGMLAEAQGLARTAVLEPIASGEVHGGSISEGQCPSTEVVVA